MAKPLDFSIAYKYRTTNVTKKLNITSPAESLSKELNLNLNYIYSIFKRLREKGFLIITEDNLVVVNDDLKQVRVTIKDYLTKFDVVNFNYVFATKTVEDESDNTTNLPTSSEPTKS